MFYNDRDTEINIYNQQTVLYLKGETTEYLYHFYLRVQSGWVDTDIHAHLNKMKIKYIAF